MFHTLSVVVTFTGDVLKRMPQLRMEHGAFTEHLPVILVAQEWRRWAMEVLQHNLSPKTEVKAEMLRVWDMKLLILLILVIYDIIKYIMHVDISVDVSVAVSVDLFVDIY